jgi:hypothetical protein
LKSCWAEEGYIKKTTIVGLTERIRLAPTMWWDPVLRRPGINYINYTKREKASSTYDTKQCKKFIPNDKKHAPLAVKKTPQNSNCCLGPINSLKLKITKLYLNLEVLMFFFSWLI